MSSEGVSASVDSEAFAGGPNSPVVNEPVAPVAEEAAAAEPKTFDEAYVKQLREEAAKSRVERQTEKKTRESLEARLQAFEDAQLTETERATKEFNETREKASKYEQKAREAELKYQLAMAAKESNIVDLKAAVKLADRELIQFDDNGNINNMSEIIDSLKNEYASLFNASAPNAPHTGVTNPAKAPSAKKYTRADLAKMPAERIVELQAAGELNHILGGGGR